MDPRVYIGDRVVGPGHPPFVVAEVGACLLEKHFTLDHDLPGPDHWFSEDPDGLASWVASIRAAHCMLGSPVVRPSAIERGNKNEYQRHLVAARDITAGEIFSPEAITLRRVAGGRGLPPAFLDYLLDRAAPRAYRAGEPIEF